MKPLGFIPAGPKDVTIMVDGLPGAEDDIQIFDINGKHLVGTPAVGVDSDPVWTLNGIDSVEKLKDTLFTAENGFQSADGFDGSEPLLHYADTAGKTYGSALADGISLSYNGMTFTYTGDGDRFPSDTDTTTGSTDANHSVERLRIDEVKEPLFLVVAGTGVFDIAAEWGEMPAGNVAPVPSSNAKVSTSTQIVLGASFGSAPDTVTIEATPADSTSLGLAEVELDPFEKAQEAMRKLQEAMNQVDGYRGQYGALTNRFEGAIDNLAQQSISTDAARGRILDADYAAEVAKMTRAQILQQSGISALSQANQIPQGVLSLLH